MPMFKTRVTVILIYKARKLDYKEMASLAQRESPGRDAYLTRKTKLSRCHDVIRNSNTHFSSMQDDSHRTTAHQSWAEPQRSEFTNSNGDRAQVVT